MRPWLLAFLAMGITALAALNIAGFIGGQFDARLDVVTHGAPALLAIGMLLTGLAWLVGGKRWLIVTLAVGLGPPGVAIAGDAISGLRLRSSAGDASVKVLTLNVWSQNRDLDRVEALIRTEAPDIVFLQETSTKRHRELLRRLGDMYPTNVNIQPHCSTRVISRFRLIEARGYASCALVGARLALPAESGGGEVLAIAVHMPRTHAADGGADARAALELFPQLAETSAIVGGDFNRTPWSATIGRLDRVAGIERRTHAMATWPSSRQSPMPSWSPTFPLLPIDHVYATSDWRTVSTRVGPDAGSDHQPIIVELTRSSYAPFAHPEHR